MLCLFAFEQDPLEHLATCLLSAPATTVEPRTALTDITDAASTDRRTLTDLADVGAANLRNFRTFVKKVLKIKIVQNNVLSVLGFISYRLT